MEPNNQRLEEVLKLAATDAAHRPEFFSLLMSASVWIPGHYEDQQISDSTPVRLNHWQTAEGSRVVPFFTSQQALTEASQQEQQSYVVMPVRTLFELTRGETLLLNPDLPFGKTFLPAEVALLLEEQGSALTQHTVLEGNSTLLVSDIVDPPAQMVASLTGLFSKYKTVRRAWLAGIKETAEQPSNLLIGIEAEGDIESLIQAAGSVAMDTMTDDQPVDICQVTENQPGISHFLTAHITPFYERRWGSFLREFKPGERII